LSTLASEWTAGALALAIQTKRDLYVDTCVKPKGTRTSGREEKKNEAIDGELLPTELLIKIIVD
jgi:hypothetical protein